MFYMRNMKFVMEALDKRLESAAKKPIIGARYVAEN